jgi:hypothetical protein
VTREPWWKWEWDTQSWSLDHHDTAYRCDRFTRWRRGWVTLYKFESDYPDSVCVEWRLYLPFNLSVGIEYDRRM